MNILDDERNQNQSMEDSVLSKVNSAICDQYWAKINSLTKRVKSAVLRQDEFLIGRLPECNIVVNDKKISGKHCRIFKKTDPETGIV